MPVPKQEDRRDVNEEKRDRWRSPSSLLKFCFLKEILRSDNRKSRLELIYTPHNLLIEGL